MIWGVKNKKKESKDEDGCGRTKTFLVRTRENGKGWTSWCFPRWLDTEFSKDGDVAM